MLRRCNGEEHKRDGGPAPDERIELAFEKIAGGRGGYNRWSINGKSWPSTTPLFTTEPGKRYRLVMINNSGDNHPVTGQDNCRCQAPRLPWRSTGCCDRPQPTEQSALQITLQREAIRPAKTSRRCACRRSRS
jgi:hypothetical protein